MALVQQLGPLAPEVEESYERARVLCEASGNLEERFKALWGLWFVNLMRGNMHRERELGNEVFALAQALGDPTLMLEAHHVQWSGLGLVGDLAAVREHTEDGIARYNTEDHHWLTFVYGGHDPGACSRNLNAIALWLLGYSDQARQRSADAVALARQLDHPYTLLEGLFCASLVGLFDGDTQALLQHAEVLDRLVHEQKLPAGASSIADGFRGCVLVKRGELEPGLQLMRDASSAWREIFGAWCFPLDASLASALNEHGDIDEALDLVTSTLDAAEEGGAHWWDAELYRVRGEILLRAQQRPEAERCVKKAIELACAQTGKWMELRAVSSLAQLWSSTGKRVEAREALAAVYSWFSEGFDTPDLRSAKTLLDSLA